MGRLGMDKDHGYCCPCAKHHSLTYAQQPGMLSTRHRTAPVRGTLCRVDEFIGQTLRNSFDVAEG